MVEHKSLIKGPSHVDVRQKALPDVISDVLREDLTAGRYSPDEKISLRSLAERFNVSTMPVREALRQLEAEGLIEFDKNRRISVRALSAREAEELFAIRMELEPLALLRSGERLAKSKKALDTLEKLIDRMDKESDPDKWRDLNGQFHKGLRVADESPRLDTLINSLWAATEAYLRRFLRTESHIERAQEQHREMIDLLRGGNADAAAEILRDHISYSRDSITRDLFSE